MSATILSGLIILTVPFLRRDHFLQWGVQQASGPTRFPYCKIPYMFPNFQHTLMDLFIKDTKYPFNVGPNTLLLNVVHR